MIFRQILPILLGMTCATTWEAPCVAADVSFSRDVMAVLSKAGCNMGACHGNQNGKGGFRLSLRGQDADFDFDRLTREANGRRINRLTPEQSLLLLKPTGRVAHQGGVRFKPDSREYQVLSAWITAGAPARTGNDMPLVKLDVTPREQVSIGELQSAVQFAATATFADGTTRDVTTAATYEATALSVEVSPAGQVRRRAFGEATVIVRYLQQQIAVSLAFVPDRTAVAWAQPTARNFIDEHVQRKLLALRMTPSELADDHVFVRRVFLDAIGLLPTADEAREFVADSRADKRERLIDGLLARPEFADLWALKWSDVLRNEEKVLDPKGVEVFHAWIRASIAVGQPLDQFVRELLRATGSTYDNPPANFWRANRDAATRAETTARLFLGVRLQCAKCHNHPFDRWTQDDYYAWSAVFARLDYDILKNERKDKLDLNEFNGEQIVNIAYRGHVKHPRTGETVAARLLGDRELLPGSYQDRLTPLAVWLTAPDNRLFARAMANFIWYHIMGRGIVEPIDDLRATNPPVNPALLDALADDFVAHGFDLRHLVRTILVSRTYQTSAVPNATNQDDEANFARAVVARLSAEKLLDAQNQVLGLTVTFSGYDQPLRAGQIPGVRRDRSRGKPLGGGDRFLRTFGKPERLLACECERSNETTLAQAFVLISGDETQRRLADPANRLAQSAWLSRFDAEVIDELYWSALCRPPSTDERQAAERLFATGDRLAAAQDLTWALLNAKEFVLRW